MPTINGFRVTSRSRLAGSASLQGIAMLLCMAAAAPAAAQSTMSDANTASANEADEADAIVVTGFRRSLESAVAEKKNIDQIVESISAEDIGRLPDASIAESIARLPGITSQRVSGRSMP